MRDWLVEFKDNSIFRIDESERMLRICMEHLSEDHFWKKPNAASNAVGHLLLHLSGNIRQYIISGLGGAVDLRDRDAEFSASGRRSKEEVWEQLRQTLKHAREAIANASEGRMLERRRVQGFKLSGLGMVLHAVEHLSYHTGQVAYAVKYLQGKPLGFYDGMDLNSKNG